MTNLQEIEGKISELVVQTMQEMAFIDVVKEPQNNLDPTSAIFIKLEVIMPYSGDIMIGFDEELAKEFALNVFGKEQYEQLQNPIMDASSEFLNVIIGKIIGKLSPELLFELGLPQPLSNKGLDFSPYVIQRYVTPEGRSMNFYFRLERLVSVLGL